MSIIKRPQTSPTATQPKTKIEIQNFDTRYGIYTEEYRNCGIHFEQDPDNPDNIASYLVSFDLSMTETAKRLAQVSPASWIVFESFKNNDYCDLYETTRAFAILNTQKSVLKSGSYRTRFSHAFGQGQILDEIGRLTDEFQRLGIAPVVGTEVETSIDQFPPGYPHADASQHWVEQRDHFLREMTRDHRQSDVLGFGARDVLCLELHEHTPELRGALYPRFGTGRAGGYYDAPGITEFQIRECDPLEQIRRRKLLEKELLRRADQYQLHTEAPSYHTNISFSIKGYNIFDPNSPYYHTHGRYALAGMARAFYDAASLISKDDKQKECLRYMGVGISRMTYLRHAFGRLEVRTNDLYTSKFTETVQEPDLILAIGLAGALYGLRSKDTDPNVKQLTLVRKPHFRSEDNLKLVTHILNGGTLDQFGNVKVDQEYLNEMMVRLGEEIGLIEPKHIGVSFMAQTSAHQTFSQKHGSFVKKLFDSIRVTPKGEVIWPQDRYDPLLSKITQRLKDGIQLVSVDEYYVNTPGYDLNDFSNVPDDARLIKPYASRRHRLMGSKALRTTLSRSFRLQFQAASCRPKPNKIGKKTLKNILAQINNAQWEKRWRGDQFVSTEVSLTATEQQMAEIQRYLAYLLHHGDNEYSLGIYPKQARRQPNGDHVYNYAMISVGTGQQQRLIDVLKNPRVAKRKAAARNHLTQQRKNPKNQISLS